MFRPVRGMKDFYGLDLAKYNYIIKNAEKVSEKYGYSQIRTPILEYTDVFQRSIGEETDVVSKEMYTFIDKGGESLTLRPEGTAGVIRSVVSEGLIHKLPLKVMYAGEMFRYDRPQKGRFRQFHQLGFEHLGDKSPYTDALTMAMGAEILNSIGLFDVNFLINTLGDAESKASYTKAISKFLSRYESELSEESKLRLKKNPLRVLDSKDSKDKEICSMAPMISDYLTKESGRYFEEVCVLLNSLGINYDIDNYLVRGLDYYSNVAFEIKLTSGSYKDAIGGGGRYDNLVAELGGNSDVSGVGFAFGVERLIMTMDNNNIMNAAKKVAVIPVSEDENTKAFELLQQLHNSDIAAEFISLGNMSKKLKIADRLNCSFAAIIGETELENNTVTIKLMDAKEDNSKTKTVNFNQTISFIKNKLI